MGIFEIFAIPFGWVMWACYQLVKNYGVALILFTLITKVIMLPLSIKQQKSSAKMAYYKPQIDAIQKKYGNNRTKLAEETQKFYEQEGYNPSSGCLPLLITFPVLFGVVGVVYRPLTHILRLAPDVLTNFSEAVKAIAGEAGKLANYPELNILSALGGEKSAEVAAKLSTINPDALSKIQNFDNSFLGLGIDFSAIPSYTSWLILIPIFAALAGFASSFISMRLMKNNSDEASAAAAKTNTVMLVVMPVITFFFAMGLPCGIGFYWIVSNIFALAQSFVLTKIYNPKKLAEQFAAEAAERKAKQKEKKQAMQEARRKAIEERENAVKEEKDLTPEEMEAEKERISEAIEKLNEARRRDAEKYGEVFVPATEEDVK